MYCKVRVCVCVLNVLTLGERVTAEQIESSHGKGQTKLAWPREIPVTLRLFTSATARGRTVSWFCL